MIIGRPMTEYYPPIARKFGVKEIAELFEVHHMTVYQWIWSGKLKRSRCPETGKLVIVIGDLKNFVERGNHRCGGKKRWEVLDWLNEQTKK